MTAVIQMIQEGQYSKIDLDRFLFELETRFKQREVMNTKEAAVFLGMSTSKLYKSEAIPFHKVEGMKVYLRQELIDYIKKS